MSNMAANVVRVIQNIPRLIRGQVTFAELWTPLAQGFQNTIRELPNIPQREMSALERALDEQVRREAEALGRDYATFREERLRQLGVTPSEQRSLQRQSEDLGRDMGEGLGHGFQKEAEKWDAALRKSAEGLFRISQYLQRVRNPEANRGETAQGEETSQEEVTALTGAGTGVANAAAVAQGNVGAINRPNVVNNNNINNNNVGQLVAQQQMTNQLLSQLVNNPPALLAPGAFQGI
jgi:hypothetical protein